MLYDVKILQGIAELTRDWSLRKEDLFRFACERGGERWQGESFRNHMYMEYFKGETPVTARMYSLDDNNLRLVLEYVSEKLMGGLASRELNF